MSGRIDDGGAAFPSHSATVFGAAATGGISLRDWFAGQGLAALAVFDGPSDATKEAAEHFNYRCAMRAYRLADAMLRQRDIP
jgi:hypothetical protein